MDWFTQDEQDGDVFDLDVRFTASYETPAIPASTNTCANSCYPSCPTYGASCGSTCTCTCTTSYSCPGYTCVGGPC